MGLLAQIFGKRRGTPADCVRALPPDCRVYAVGDIHGRQDLLAELYQDIEAHHRANPCADSTVVFLGDYVDRGLESRGVIEFLLHDLAPDFTHVFLKGNHEDLLLRFLDAPQETATLWFENGGLATLLSYGVGRSPSEAGDADLQDLADKLRQTIPDDHIRFFQGLQLTHQVGDYLFVHAGVRPGRALEEQSPEDLLWIRRAFLDHHRDFGLTVVHGHSTATTPQLAPGRIGVDTGAYATGRLTAAVLEADRLDFLVTGQRAH